MEPYITKAAKTIHNSKALLITAGAGLGVDSGLPDFRGPEGFWKAYPPLKERNLTLPQTSTLHWFDTDPHFAWGFFGHRYKLYSQTSPHAGFQILRKWAQQMEHGYFVFTSNVDGHFQKAGFSEDRVVECHGSIHYMQATRKYNDIWPVPDGFVLDTDDTTLRAVEPMPRGPPGRPEGEQVLARPNILMFSDFSWISDREDEQEKRCDKWIDKTLAAGIPITVVEIGSSDFVPTVRMLGEDVASRHPDGCLIRINPRDHQVKGRKNISVPMKGLEALEKIDQALMGL